MLLFLPLLALGHASATFRIVMAQTGPAVCETEMHIAATTGLLLSMMAIFTPSLAHHHDRSDHSRLLLAMGKEPSVSPSTSVPVKALFDSKVEAEKAAVLFNCKGAHQMGAKWMPCQSHNHGANAGH